MWKEESKEERKEGRGIPSLCSELLLEIENSVTGHVTTGLRVFHTQNVVVSLPDGSQPTPLLGTYAL